MRTETNHHFEGYLKRKEREHGDRFDARSLAPQFIPFYGTGRRVKVRFSYGEEVTGTIGATTGWRPSFLLVRRSSDRGSSWTLGPDDQIIAVQRRHGGEYIPI